MTASPTIKNITRIMSKISSLEAWTTLKLSSGVPLIYCTGLQSIAKSRYILGELSALILAYAKLAYRGCRVKTYRRALRLGRGY